MKVAIANHDGRCSECGKEIKRIRELYFCSKKCADKFKQWCRDNLTGAEETTK